MSLNSQFYLLIHTLLYGTFIGITFDCIWILKSNLEYKYLKIAVMLVYWIAQIPLAYIYIYNVNDGIFHLYISLFMIIGSIVYFKWMKPVFYQDLEILGRNIYQILKFLKKLLNILVISPILFIYKHISVIIVKILKILKIIWYTPFVKIKRDLNKKKVKRRAKKVDGNKAE